MLNVLRPAGSNWKSSNFHSVMCMLQEIIFFPPTHTQPSLAPLLRSKITNI